MAEGTCETGLDEVIETTVELWSGEERRALFASKEALVARLTEFVRTTPMNVSVGSVRIRSLLESESFRIWATAQANFEWGYVRVSRRAVLR